MSQEDRRYLGFWAGTTACVAMSQELGAGSLANFPPLHNKLLSPTLGERLAQHGKNVGRRSYSTALCASLTSQKALDNNLKEDTHPNTILEMLHKRNYVIDFHGYSRFQALKELQDIIIFLTHNMKGKSEQQFTIITGKGNHSLEGKPIIKTAVLDYLETNRIIHKEQENNCGRINIIVQKK